MGIGDWGLGMGIGDWAQSPIPKYWRSLKGKYIINYKNMTLYLMFTIIL